MGSSVILGNVKTVDIDQLLARDERALARAISLIESGDERGQELLKVVRARGGSSRVVGITGSPGSGKSTLTDRLIGCAREVGRSVAVVAVDPSSPYTGGAILGDRIRMTRWHQDPQVFIRSMATRGHLGGLAAATLQVVALLEGCGLDDIFIETVGVGQSEVDIVQVADSTVLVLTPGHGDGVQAAKAGVMEIADLFAINKADLPGATRLRREVEAMLELGSWPKGSWRPRVLELIATEDQGVGALNEALHEHHQQLQDSGGLVAMRRQRARFEVATMLEAQVRRVVKAQEERVIDAVLSGETTPAEVAQSLLHDIR